MYTSFYGMNSNPFIKAENYKNPLETNDYKETIQRLNYIKEIRGIGIIYGENGLGKTYALKSFINSLNKELYKVIYINPTIMMTTFDFISILSNELNLDTGACYKSQLLSNIQKEIMRIVDHEKVNVIVIIDDAHLLSREILLTLKILYDFEMNSKDYVSLILMGQEELRVELSKKVHTSLNQRINANYRFNGLSRDEVKEYVKTRLEIANANKNIFGIDALNSLYSCSKSSFRKLNTLIINCLILGFQKNKPIIDNEIVMLAKREMDLK